MNNALLLRHRTSGLTIVAIFLGFAMLFSAGMNSANAQYNDYGYENSYSNDYGYNNGYNYSNYDYDSGYSSSSSSSSSNSEGEGNSFWWYVLAVVLFILFGGQGLKAANTVSKGKLDQKTNGFATNLSKTNPNGIGIVGNCIANQTNIRPNNQFVPNQTNTHPNNQFVPNQTNTHPNIRFVPHQTNTRPNKRRY